MSRVFPGAGVEVTLNPGTPFPKHVSAAMREAPGEEILFSPSFPCGLAVSSSWGRWGKLLRLTEVMELILPSHELRGHFIVIA